MTRSADSLARVQLGLIQINADKLAALEFAPGTWEQALWIGRWLFAVPASWQSGFVTLDEKERQLAGELAALPDAPARLAWLIERARQRPMLPAELRLDSYLVEGCLSKLWFVTEFREGRCWFRSESDSLVVKSVAGLLCDFYNGHPPAEIVKHPPVFLSSVGIPHYLTPNRRGTMGRVWEKIRAFAEKHASPPVGSIG